MELDETIANVETDKVTVEVKSPAPGVLTKLYVAAGDTVAVGKPLFGVDIDAAKPEGAGSKPAEKKEEPKKVDTPQPSQPAQTQSAPKPAAQEAPKADKPKSTPPPPPPVMTGERK